MNGVIADMLYNPGAGNYHAELWNVNTALTVHTTATHYDPAKTAAEAKAWAIEHDLTFLGTRIPEKEKETERV